MFIGELSVLDNSPFWHFDEEFCKWHISNHNLKRELEPVQYLNVRRLRRQIFRQMASKFRRRAMAQSDIAGPIVDAKRQ